MNKSFFITRLEESRVLKRIEYEIIAPNKKQAIKQLKLMKYMTRDTIDEIEEDEWKPLEIILIEEFGKY